jgi:hypothetical protein
MPMIDLLPGTTVTNEEGHVVVLEDGEEQVPVTGVSVTRSVYGVRLYGEEYEVEFAEILRTRTVPGKGTR